MKFLSSVESVAIDIRVRVNFSRCAPLAAKLDDPVALSNRDVSSSGVIIDSSTLSPIFTFRPVPPLYLSRIIFWSSTLTK